MLSRDIVRFSKMRYEIRAYMCFLFERHIQNYLSDVGLQKIISHSQKLTSEIEIFDVAYILDKDGMLVSNFIGSDSKIELDERDLSDRAFFYDSVKEGRCILTDPYPSKHKGRLIVTASYPIYNDKKELLYVMCIDIPLKEILKVTSSSGLYQIFSSYTIMAYSMLSVMLSFVAMLLFAKGISSFLSAMVHFNKLDIKEVFEATILLTLSLAIVDLVKAIFEEEVLGKNSGENHYAVHKTMIRFLGSIIIALAIEALMLVFKFSIIEPEKIQYTLYLTGGVSLLLLGLSVYVKFAYSVVRDDRR